MDIVDENIFKLKECEPIISQIADICIKAIQSGGKIIFCGNGGSAADAQHLAAELMGEFKLDRQALPAISLTVNTSVLTAIGNDFDYKNIFSRQLSGIGKNGDVLIAISTSGNSENVIKAVQTANKMGIKTVAFTGKTGGDLALITDASLKVPSDVTNNIQEMHIVCGHIICDLVECYFYKE